MIKESLLIISHTHQLPLDAIDNIATDIDHHWTLLTDQKHDQEFYSHFEHIVTIDWEYKKRIQDSPILGEEVALNYLLKQLNPIMEKNWNEIINLSKIPTFLDLPNYLKTSAFRGMKILDSGLFYSHSEFELLSRFDQYKYQSPTFISWNKIRNIVATFKIENKNYTYNLDQLFSTLLIKNFLQENVETIRKMFYRFDREEQKIFLLETIAELKKISKNLINLSKNNDINENDYLLHLKSNSPCVTAALLLGTLSKMDKPVLSKIKFQLKILTDELESLAKTNTLDLNKGDLSLVL